MPHIDYYLTPMSPYVHMVGNRAADIAKAAGATLRYKPLDPAALFKRTGGQMLADRHDSRKAYRLQELARWAKRLDIPLTLRPAHFPTNPAPASYAIIAAQEAGGGDVTALVTSLTRAIWEQERNIADDDVIRDCLSGAGFDPALAFSGMLQGAEIYARNLEDAVAGGIFGIPSFKLDDQIYWGQDRLDFLADALGVTL
jgi:2-hydroxychromene-2-carboxylate isomerase